MEAPSEFRLNSSVDWQCYSSPFKLFSRLLFLCFILASPEVALHIGSYLHQQKGLSIIFEYIYYNVLTYDQIYTSLIHTLIRLYISRPLVDNDFRVGEGSSVLKALGGLPGSDKSCQGSTLCSFLQVSKRYPRL